MRILALRRLSSVVVVVTVAAANALSALSPPRHDGSAFTVLPSRIEFDQVSQNFPLTLQRRLFSSVPYREWALRDVTFAAESELLVLTGDSSSGKTTILQTILHGQDRQPSAGGVTISSSSVVQSGSTPRTIAASPIYLDQRPPFERSRSIAKIVMDEGQTGNKKIPALILQQLTNDLLVLVDLESRKHQTPAELSPSEQYRLELARASLTSMLSKYENSSSDDTPAVVLLPAPILLADEWLDKETSLVVQAVQASMQRLIHQLGAVILVATHKPERWNMSACSHMKLSGGKIVSLCRTTMATNKSTTAT